MPLNLCISRAKDFTLATVSGGPPTLPELSAVLEGLRAATEQDVGGNLFIDLTQVEGVPRFTDQFLLGSAVARELGHLARIASLVRQNERTGISGKVASLQGKGVRTFECRATAIAWLLQAQAPGCCGLAPVPT